ncbi:MAG TPA: hypothetical protein ENN76_02195, partial [Euryarchaeota archaeon]|nr:hypothetical protein [Euryarchaeota archaeon]
MDVRHLFDKLSKWKDVGTWWPGEDPFEIAVGAILTTRTRWENVRTSISKLKSAGLLNPKDMKRASREEVESLIRPCGFYRQKAERLQLMARFFCDLDGRRPTREKLLSLKGIGEETADSILLYSFDVPVFVVDAYTLRLFSRLPIKGDPRGVETIMAQPRELKSLHGLIVELC